MSSETPAKHLARLKVRYSTWSISHGNPWTIRPGNGYTARRGEERVWAATIGDLEIALDRADPGGWRP